MKSLLKGIGIAAVFAASAATTAAPAATQDTAAVTGRWDAALVDNGPDIPFRLDIEGDGKTLKGIFYDGSRPNETTTSASFQDGRLVLKAEHYLTTITAQLRDGKLVGDTQLVGPGYSIKFGFRAVRHVPAPAFTGTVPSIAGSWVIPLAATSSKGEKAFRFIVEQKGAELEASILRVDGDTGAYSGSYRDGKWVLSHFDGHRPGVIEVSAKPDGTLAVIDHNEALVRALEGSEGEDGGDKAYSEGRLGAASPKYTAYRPDVARAKGLPEPANFLTHTSVRDPNEHFRFRFPDISGTLVTNDDPYFEGNVVLAIVTGTWCPNCHDEAQYLVELDKKYRDKGLRIVALNFEEAEQQESLERVRAFIKQYGVQYPYLLAGAPSDMWEKVPQLVNLNTWPATVFIGRDGKVRAVHAGFASPATGEFRAQQDNEFTTRIEQLLAEKAPVDHRVSYAFPRFEGP